jgi:ABC-2 type transport system ATP-binding protein
MRGLAAEGRAVLVSSHLMGELQDVADHVVLVGRGRVLADSTVADLLAGASGGRVVVRTTAAQAADVLNRAGATVTVLADALAVDGLPAEAVIAALTAAGLPFSEVSTHRATLEQVYLELTRDAVQYRATSPEAAR